jgi:hypothetical protein
VVLQLHLEVADLGRTHRRRPVLTLHEDQWRAEALPERPTHVILDDQIDLLVTGAVGALYDLKLRLD